jgi:hypothetical protein
MAKWAQEDVKTSYNLRNNNNNYYYLFFTAVGFTPGGSSTAHIYTQTVHRIQRTVCNNKKKE